MRVKESGGGGGSTHRLGLELGVHLVQAGVEATEGADVLLILPRHLLGFAPLRRSMRERRTKDGQLPRTVGQ